MTSCVTVIPCARPSPARLFPLLMVWIIFLLALLPMLPCCCWGRGQNTDVLHHDVAVLVAGTMVMVGSHVMINHSVSIYKN